MRAAFFLHIQPQFYRFHTCSRKLFRDRSPKPAKVLTFSPGTPRAAILRSDGKREQGTESERASKREREYTWVREGTGSEYDISHCAERVGLVSLRLHTKSRIVPERCSEPVFSPIRIGGKEWKGGREDDITGQWGFSRWWLWPKGIGASRI